MLWKLNVLNRNSGSPTGMYRHNWYISGSTKPIKTVETVLSTLALLKTEFLIKISMLQISVVFVSWMNYRQITRPRSRHSTLSNQLISRFCKAYKDGWKSKTLFLQDIIFGRFPRCAQHFSLLLSAREFQLFLFSVRLLTNKATSALLVSLASRHTLKPTDISGFIQSIKTVETINHSPCKAEFLLKTSTMRRIFLALH